MVALSRYLELIAAFTSRKMNATDFESRYFELFKTDRDKHPAETFAILDALFADLDTFCADPNLRDESDLDEDQLRGRAQVALEKLRKLQS